jgi:transposase
LLGEANCVILLPNVSGGEVMTEKIYKVTLTNEERKELTALVTKGKGNVRRLRRAQILLMADEGQEGGCWKDSDIAKALNAHVATIERTRKACVLDGIEGAMNHTRPKKSRSKRLDGAGEARLAQLACSQAPAGHEKWTLRLLANRLIELEVVDTISVETVRTTLKKMNLNLG